MKVMVTGSMGYIGNNLCHTLTDYGDDVIQIDKCNKKDINSIDFYDYTDCDVIVHLAALPGIQACEDNPQQAFKDNIAATIKISNFAREFDIPVLFASSQASKTPLESIYAMNKYVCEGILLENNDCIIMNFSNIYGGKGYLEKKTSIMSVFTQQMQHGSPLTIDGDGSQVRDFIHVDDIIEAIIALIVTMGLNGLNGKVIDIGTGIGTSIKELAEMFLVNTINPKIIYSDARSAGVQGNIANPSAMKDIGWEARITIEQGVRKMLEEVNLWIG